MTNRKRMFDENARRTGFVTEYGAEDKFAAAVAAHDSVWFEHKERCVAERLQHLEGKGAIENQELLKKELERLEKHVATSAYHDDGWLKTNQLEISQYSMVIDMLTYRTLCKLVK